MKIKTPAALAVLSLISPWGLAQTAPPANAPVQDMGRVEIKSNRDNTMEERRQSTAAKIVIGREACPVSPYKAHPAAVAPSACEV